MQSKTYDALFKSQVQEYRASSVPLDLSGGPLLGLSCLRPVLPGEKLQLHFKGWHYTTGRVPRSVIFDRESPATAVRVTF